MRSVLVWTAPVILAVALIWVLTDLGLWYSGTIVGFMMAFYVRRTWRSLWMTWLAVIGTWGLELLWQAQLVPIGEAASIVAGIMGFGHSSIIVITLTLVVAWLLGTVGTWLGLALTNFLPSRTFFST